MAVQTDGKDIKCDDEVKKEVQNDPDCDPVPQRVQCVKCHDEPPLEPSKSCGPCVVTDRLLHQELKRLLKELKRLLAATREQKDLVQALKQPEAKVAYYRKENREGEPPDQTE